jgi:hypothetical protein
MLAAASRATTNGALLPVSTSNATFGFAGLAGFGLGLGFGHVTNYKAHMSV